MNPTPLRILLDTNVWLDLFIPSNPGHAIAWKLIRLAAAYEDPAGRDVVLLYPARILGDVFYKVRLEAKRWVASATTGSAEAKALACRDHAWDCINDLCELGQAVGMDEADVWLARKYRAVHEDLEDNFVLAAADRAQVDYLVSSDVRLLRKARVPAVAPAELLRILEASIA
jgi:predicted nucleic acid-binding protein